LKIISSDKTTFKQH